MTWKFGDVLVSAGEWATRPIYVMFISAEELVSTFQGMGLRDDNMIVPDWWPGAVLAELQVTDWTLADAP